MAWLKLINPEDYPQAYCNAWVATAIIGSAAVGAAATAYSANKASNAQTAAANQSAAIAREQYQQTREDLSPYRAAGANATTELQNQLPFLTSPITMDQATLEATPGYQFTKTQGLKAVQNSAAARGLGVSGAALKGAATFATGLADQTYQTQFNLENTNRTNAYNRLKGLVDVGENASAQTGILGEKSAYQQGQAAIGAGNAQAAGINATGAAAKGFASDVGGYYAYRGLYGSPDNSTIQVGNATNNWLTSGS